MIKQGDLITYGNFGNRGTFRCTKPAPDKGSETWFYDVEGDRRGMSWIYGGEARKLTREQIESWRQNLHKRRERQCLSNNE